MLGVVEKTFKIWYFVLVLYYKIKKIYIWGRLVGSWLLFKCQI